MCMPTLTTVKLAIGILCALALALVVHDRNRWKSVAALRQQQVVVEKAAHSATIAYYRAAADRARQADQANVARVKRDQSAINERTADDFEKRIDAARARASGLQRQAGGPAADPGAGGTAHMSALSPAPGKPAEAPGEGGLPVADRLLATEQAIQLDELIDWVSTN
ncbi:MAG: hypothetical protein WKF52_09770 [Sphingomicrobium sp.]